MEVDMGELDLIAVPSLELPRVMEFAAPEMAKRKKLSAQGKALPDGSYPIENGGDLKNAIQAHGRTKDPEKKQKVKRHIVRRARAMKLAHMVPSTWQVTSAGFDLSEVLAKLPPPPEPTCGEFVAAPGPCSLDRSSKHNWVEDVGGLPNYICQVARAVARGGKSLDSAIPIAIATIKKWTAGGGSGGGKKVSAAVQARASAALAEWEAKKAKAHAKKSASVDDVALSVEDQALVDRLADGLAMFAEMNELALLGEFADGSWGGAATQWGAVKQQHAQQRAASKGGTQPTAYKKGSDVGGNSPEARAARNYSRAPAGGRNGGQFAPKGTKGGSSSSTGGRTKAQIHADAQKRAQASAQAKAQRQQTAAQKHAAAVARQQANAQAVAQRRDAAAKKRAAAQAAAAAKAKAPKPSSSGSSTGSKTPSSSSSGSGTPSSGSGTPAIAKMTPQQYAFYKRPRSTRMLPGTSDGGVIVDHATKAQIAALIRAGWKGHPGPSTQTVFYPPPQKTSAATPAASTAPTQTSTVTVSPQQIAAASLEEDMTMDSTQTSDEFGFWKPELHPRDMHGRFIEIHDRVRLPGNEIGRVVRLKNNLRGKPVVEIARPGGANIDLPPDRVETIKVDEPARPSDKSVANPYGEESPGKKRRRLAREAATPGRAVTASAASTQNWSDGYIYYWDETNDSVFRVSDAGVEGFDPDSETWQGSELTEDDMDNFPSVDDPETLQAITGSAQVAEAEAETTDEPEEDEYQGRRFKIPLLIPEGVASGDRRTFTQGALEYKEPPIQLLWQRKTDDGHKGSVIVGRIDKIERLESGGIGNAEGVFDTNEDAQEAMRQVKERYLTGVSGDVDQFEHELSEDDKGREAITIKHGRLVAATLVAKPAFQEATIEMVPVDGEESVITAAGGPLFPPMGWFREPKMSSPEMLTIEDDGRVHGLIAEWGTPHTGNPSLRPPKNFSGYSFFNRKPVRTHEGTDVRCGQLTLTGGHADLSLDSDRVVRHYDDTRSAVADVVVGENKFGIWAAGALRSDVTDEQLRAFRASEPSGDWRMRNGNLELLACCMVNVAGFPVSPRAMVASGEVLALVAAGMPTHVASATLSQQVEELSGQVNVLMTELEARRRADLQASIEALRS